MIILPLTFPIHDNIPNYFSYSSHPTAKASNTSTALSWGSTSVIDDALTAGPELNSTEIGRGQGIYAVSAQSTNETAYTMVMSLVFTSGNYNGSTVNIFGRNAVLQKTRELTVVGGTRLFRYATGYALASTYSGMVGSDTTVEYDVYVLH